MENNTPLPTESNHNGNRKFVLILGSMSIIGIIIIVAGIVFTKNLFSYPQNSKKTNTGNSLTKKSAPSFSQWINCDDIRDVIEEGNTLYLACLSGVLIMDTSGNVMDQITMSNGLSSSTTTSLAKSGETLYIGTQDGFTIYNLKDKSSKKITTKEGLINGANIKLLLDKNILWVGTFNGLDAYDINTGEIIHYNAQGQKIAGTTGYELLNGEVYSMEATENAIYFLYKGVLRFDRKDKTWQHFDEGIITASNSTLASSGGYIFISDTQRVWKKTDTKDGAWEELPEVADGLKNVGIDIIYLGSTGGKALAWEGIGKGIYEIKPETNTLVNVYPLEGQKSLLNDFSIPVFSENKVWMKQGASNSIVPLNNSDFLATFSFNTQKTEKIPLLNHPQVVKNVVALIDENPIVAGGGLYWKYDVMTKKIVSLKNMPEIAFIEDARMSPGFLPLPNTSHILILSQTCGQGCSEPGVYLYDYSNYTSKKIDFSEEINSILLASPEPYKSYLQLAIAAFDEKNQKVYFESVPGYSSNPPISFVLDISAFSWSQKDSDYVSAGLDSFEKGRECSLNYTYTTSSNTFKKVPCAALESNFPYSWQFFEEGNGMKMLFHNKKKTVAKNLLSDPIEYSPFENFNVNLNVVFTKYAYNYLWIATNRGISRYDPANNGITLYGTQQGLISNFVQGLLVGKENIWVVTSWGGLSRIAYR